MLTVYEIRRNNVELLISNSESRKSFAQKINIEYNLLNQYLSKKNPKNVGDKLALKITDAFQLPEGWLDHSHEESSIKNILKNSLTTSYVAENSNIDQFSKNHPSIDQIINVKSISLLHSLIMNKGEELEVTNDVEEVSNIYAPPGIVNPIAYQIKGTGFTKPYRNGYIVVCEYEGIPISGEEVLIHCKDGKIYAGEFLYQQDILYSIESITGEKEEILKDKVQRLSPVKAFISPSQK